MRNLTVWATLAVLTQGVWLGCGGDDTGDPGGPVAGSGGSGGSSAGSGGDGSGGSAGAEKVGSRCDDNQDCSGDLNCIQVADALHEGGGPPKGLCTAECKVDKDCAGYANAVCVGFDAGGYCLERCKFGSPADAQDFDEDKCHGRPEFACTPLVGGTSSGDCTTDAACSSDEICNDGGCVELVPACLPRCNSDADCGDRYCDLGTGVCLDKVVSGGATGAECTVDDVTMEDDCKGNCLSIVDDKGDPLANVCADGCTIGAPGGCGWADTSKPADAFCLFVSTVIEEPGFGDAASCGALCDCNEDCVNSAFICTPFTSSDYVDVLQRQGYCTLPGTDRPEIKECGGAGGNGGSGGMGGAGSGGSGGLGGAAGADFG